ncbi:Kidins220, partial [Symbiodinium sp. CCMP2456]
DSCQDPSCLAEDPVEEWLPLLLAAALPSLKGALPKDDRGLSVLPHPHPLQKKTLRSARFRLTPSGSVAFDTRRACDNCDNPIEERTWYACAEGCQVDFCCRCHKRYEQLFEGRDRSAALRAAEVATRAAAAATAAGASSRRALVEGFAFEWPHQLFQDLVRAIAGVADAKVVHVEDGHDADLAADSSFWRLIAFLQLLRCANDRPSQETRFGELTPRGPRLPEEEFVLGGIDKCDAEAEYKRWRDLGRGSSKVVASVLEQETFEVTPSFALFLAHVDLVPLGFRQRCLQSDITDMLSRARLFRRRVQPLAVKVPRSPQAEFRTAMIRQLADAASPRPLMAKFSGERGSGPGVAKEFLALAMEAIFSSKSGEGYEDGEPVFVYDADSRTYWFSETAAPVPELFHTVGVLLAQALLIGTQLQVNLPPLFYSASVGELGLADLAALKNPGLLCEGTYINDGDYNELIDYEGLDVAEVFPLDWPRSHELNPENRAEYEELTDVQTLKVHLEKSCGVPRFRQRLLSQQSILADDHCLDLPVHVQLVLLPFCSASWEQRRELVLAASRGAATLVEQLLQRPQDPNLMDWLGHSALTEAARANHMPIAALLLEAKSDPDIRDEGYTAVAFAAHAGNSDILKLLLAANANPDVTTEEGTALHQALGNYNDKKWERYETTVTLLLEFRADVDIVDKRGRTALHAASRIPGPGKPRLVKQLVMAKANVNAADKEQLTALHCSSKHGCLDSARCLLQARADVGLEDSRSRTALHAACSRFDSVPYTVAVDLLRLLLQARADKDAVDDVHGTALHYALKSKDGTMLLLRCLLDAGARMEVADKHGCTALQCALQQSYQQSGVRILFQSLPRPRRQGPSPRNCGRRVASRNLGA